MTSVQVAKHYHKSVVAINGSLKWNKSKELITLHWGEISTCLFLVFLFLERSAWEIRLTYACIERKNILADQGRMKSASRRTLYARAMVFQVTLQMQIDSPLSKFMWPQWETWRRYQRCMQNSKSSMNKSSFCNCHRWIFCERPWLWRAA